MENSVFESESVSKSYFTMAIPVVLGMVISIVYNVTDTYFIALTGDTYLVAGVSLCAPVFSLLMGIGNIFGQGGSSVISRLVGAGDSDNARSVSSFCFYAAIVFGIAAGAIMLIFCKPLLFLQGADAQTLPYAKSYFVWLAVGAPFITLSFIHINLLRSEGMAKQAMIATIGGSVLNMVLDPLLIFGFGLGAAGAAIATVMGYIFTVAFCLAVVCKKSRMLSVDYRIVPKGYKYFVQIFSIGISAALSNITQSFCLVLTNQQLLNYGSDKIAAMGIVQKICMIVMLVIVGFSFGGAPLIGFYFGSGNKEKLKKLLRFVLTFLCGTAAVLSAVMILAAPLAIRIFLKEEELIGIGIIMLRTQLAGMVFMAVVLFLTVYFQAVGAAVPALVMSLSRQGVVFAAVLFAAVRIAGYNGVIWTQFFADLVSAILAVVLYAVTARRSK